MSVQNPKTDIFCTKATCCFCSFVYLLPYTSIQIFKNVRGYPTRMQFKTVKQTKVKLKRTQSATHCFILFCWFLFKSSLLALSPSFSFSGVIFALIRRKKPCLLALFFSNGFKFLLVRFVFKKQARHVQYSVYETHFRFSLGPFCNCLKTVLVNYLF